MAAKYDATWLYRARQLLGRLPIKGRESHINVPFVLNYNQEKLFKVMVEQWENEGMLRIIILKARRVGMSSLVDAILWAYCLAFPSKNVKILAHLAGSAEELFRVPTELAKAFPGFAITDIQAKRLIFRHHDGDSQITMATAGTPSAGRGGTLSALHLSEAALYPSAEIFPSMISSVSKGLGSIRIIECTANGKEGPGAVFFEYWEGAAKGGNGYIPVFLSWMDDPACVRPAEEAEDAPRDDLERELMNEPFNATHEQIAWMRMTKEDDCQGMEPRWLTEYPHCLVGNSLVSTDDGIIPIRYAKAGKQTESGLIVNWWNQGVRPTYIARTKMGRRIQGTYDHPLQTIQGLSVHLGMSEGALIQLKAPRFAQGPYHVCWTGICGTESKLTIDERMGRFLGYFMGDGSFGNKQISICCTAKDADVVEDVSRLMTELFGAVQPRTVGSGGGGTELRVSRPEFSSVMKRLGIWNDNPPHRKVCVPECIWRSPRPVVREFLRGLFEADGFNNYGSPQVRLFSKYRDFLESIQLLLLGFGINARVTSRPAVSKFRGNEHHYIANEVQMPSEAAIVFNEQVGFIGDRKRSRADSFSKRRAHNALRMLMEDSVETVERGDDSEVFDIEVKDSHVFSANGLLVHNCPEVAFQVTGLPAFMRDEIAYAESTIRPPLCRGRFERVGSQPKFVKDDRGPIHIWKFPFDKDGREDSYKYFVGADAALGVGDDGRTNEGDFAAYAVICGETGELAARFSERIPPEELANQLDLAGRFYRRALVNIELTGNLGRWALIKLRDVFRYPNIYTWKGRDDKKAYKGKSNSIGFEMNNATRHMIIDAARSGLRMGIRGDPGAFVVSDRALMSQIALCTMKEWRWDVLRGHDDILVAWMITCLTREQYPPSRMQYIQKNLLDEAEGKKLPVPVKQEKSELQESFEKEIKQSMRMAGLRQNMKGTGRRSVDRLAGI